MRRIVVQNLAALSFVSLVFAGAACATSSTVSDSDLVSDEKPPTIPADAGGKIPSSSTAAPSSTTTSNPPQDAGTTTTTDASTTTTDSGTSTGGGATCDPNDPTLILKVLTIKNPAPCPCGASQCCFQGQICLPN